MSELFDYLHRVVSTCSKPISFPGDVPSVINRWLLKAQDVDHYETNNTKPFLSPVGRLLLSYELEFLSQEEYEENWNIFCSEDWNRYLCDHSAIQRNYKLDKDKYIYALATVYCEEEHESLIFCDGTTPFSVWINDQLVFTSNYDHFIKKTTFVYNFKKGINIILVEKPYFLRHKELGIDPDDLVITVKPFNFCNNKKENFFFDIDIFKKLKNRYTILFNKSVFEMNETVEALVLPRYFNIDQLTEDVTICVYDEKGLLQTSLDTTTLKKVKLNLDTSYQRMFKISVRISNSIFDTYILIGDLLDYTDHLLTSAKTRKDCNTDIISSIKLLASIPNTKVGTIRDHNSMMNSEIYHMIFEKLYEFNGYLKKPELGSRVKPFDIFTYCAPIFYKTDKEDGKDNEDHYSAAYIVLPKKHNPSISYPLVINIECGYGKSQYPILREYQRLQDFSEAILLNICGSDEQNEEDPSESILFNLIENAVNEFNIDRDRIYLVGTSAGTSKAYQLGMLKPELFAAIFGINGTIVKYPNDTSFEKIDNLDSIVIEQICCVEDSVFDCSTVTETFTHVKNAKLWLVSTYSHEDFNESMNSNRVIDEVMQFRRVHEF